MRHTLPKHYCLFPRTRGALVVATVPFFVFVLACGLDVPGGDFPPVTPTPSQPTPTPVILNAPAATATPVRLAPTTTPTLAADEVAPATEPAAAGSATSTPETAVGEDIPVAGPPDGMVLVPAGTFVMGASNGADDENPAHEIDLAQFYLDVTEVTNAQFNEFVSATGFETEAESVGSSKIWRDEWGNGEDGHPVVRVSWADANAFCTWKGKRLPTEEEWEKAARGSDGRAYPWGNDYDAALVNGKDSGLRSPVPVGSYPAGASPFGVLDMAGNVREWTADPAYDPYPGNTVGSPYYGDEFRVLRGGGWFDAAADLRTPRRNPTSPSAANWDIGFRCAR